MIDNCTWGILFGVDYYFILYMNRVVSEGDIYGHVHITRQLSAFNDGHQSDPNIFQALISFLLSTANNTFGEQFETSIMIPIGRKYRLSRGSGQNNAKQSTSSGGRRTPRNHGPDGKFVSKNFCIAQVRFYA